MKAGKVLIATVDNNLGTPLTTINSPLTLLNGIDGTPERDEFIRCHINFEYDDEVQAAIGPFLTCDGVRFPFQIN